MTTFYTIILLIVFGVIASRLGIIILNIAGMPGSLIVVKDKMRSNFLYLAGIIISSIGQSYIYLTYMVFIISWINLRILTYDLPKIPILIFTFLATVFPVFGFNSAAQFEHKESGSDYINPQVLGIGFTTIISFISFFVFVFFPEAMSYFWSWVPYVTK